ncbi:MAG: ABC transporter ATP-binding protein [SAR324 cluster bacterium]|nr:ABC transporter ATP-binding protein [SAR324 cluster bacterium]
MLLKVKNLTKSFAQKNITDEIVIFNDTSFQLDHAQTLSIVGRSGSGKSTLLAMIAGIDREFKGEIEFKGDQLSSLKEKQITALRASEMGIVFQQYHLMEHLSALENVMLPLEILKINNAQAKAISLLTKVGLKNRINHFPSTLSGGEKQRVAIARAIVAKRSIILADEPTGSLDEKNGDLIIELFFDLVETYKSALVIVTHSTKIAAKADYVLQIKDGQLSPLKL